MANVYTIGSAGIKYISDHVVDPAMKTALNGILIGFVAPTYSPDLVTATPDQYTIGLVIDANGMATLYKPIIDNQGFWRWPGVASSTGIFSQQFVEQTIRPAGGMVDVPYAFPRGNEADRIAAGMRAVDGMPFYARDTGHLWLYDGSRQPNPWVNIISGAGAGTPVGAMVLWPDALTALPAPAGAWLRANGDEVSIAAYGLLYDVYNHIFDISNPPSNPNTMFRLPIYSNAIIKAM